MEKYIIVYMEYIGKIEMKVVEAVNKAHAYELAEFNSINEEVIYYVIEPKDLPHIIEEFEKVQILTSK